MKYFQPSAVAILLVLHHEYLLLNRQVAREALEVLFKKHVVFFSCGPFVLKTLLERIEAEHGPGRQWLKWINQIELDWVTFPDLRMYPPDREEGRDQWYWEQHDGEVDVDYVRGAQYNGHYDEYDHEGGFYDDNFYDPSDMTLYPSFRPPPTSNTSDPNDPFGFASHYPFTDPSHNPPSNHPGATQENLATKLELLIQMEVTPLFTYLSSPTFHLQSITLPLYFISKESHHQRSISRPGYALPLKIRYWTQVCVHALMMLSPLSTSSSPSSSSSSPSSPPALQQVRIKYLPWDVWASMDPADNLHRMAEMGIWFDGPDDGEGTDRETEGEAFRAMWASLKEKGMFKGKGRERMGLKAKIEYVPWDGNVDAYRVGDELEVVFSRDVDA